VTSTVSLPRVVVKTEPAGLGMSELDVGLGSSVSRHLTHEEALQCPPPTDSLQQQHFLPLAVSPSVVVSRRPQRPASLSFLAIKTAAHQNSNQTVRFNNAATSTNTIIEGVPIETPTSVVTSLNFDALMDGRTGLTPTNILTPVSLSFSCSSLNTPTVTAVTPAGGCSGQQRGHHYHHHLGELMGSPDNGIMKLVSL
jgi:hypothetical protein